MEAQKASVVFCLGGPGAGKGTQCSRIEETFGWKHISAGDCLREEQADDTSEYKELIESKIRNGEIVPVAITCELLKKKMRKLGGGRFLIDGFPRNLDNYEGWVKAAEGEVDTALCLYLVCSEKVMEERLLRRGESSGRADDQIATIKKRFVVFENDTKGIIEIFGKQGKCARVEAEGSVDEVWATIQAVFQDLDSRLDASSSVTATV